MIRLRLSNASRTKREPFGKHFDQVFAEGSPEADEFYESITPPHSGRRGQFVRQAIAGMLCTKQYLQFDDEPWMGEDHSGPPPAATVTRNREWFYMVNDDIISMPDKWEYPWYAAWDLAFHTLALSLVDPDFAKEQLELMLKGFHLHPNGQIPAYEWNFSDVNPPVHAWATLFLIDRAGASVARRFRLPEVPSAS